MTGWWVHNAFNDGGAFYLVSWIFWVLLSITLHELAHGWIAIWEDDRTPIETGHMTANPVVHMGTMSLIVFALIGFAWGMMPVNPMRFRHPRWGEALVAAAGPLMNLLLAAVCLTSLGVLEGLTAAEDPTTVQPWVLHLATFLWLGGWLNLILFLLNLIPVPPLDGSRILACCSYTIRDWYLRPQTQLLGLFIFMMIFIGGLADGAFLWTTRVAAGYTAAVAGLVAA